MGASGCYLDSCLKRRKDGGLVVVARVVVTVCALDSWVRLRTLDGVDSVLVVDGTVAEAVAELQSLLEGGPDTFPVEVELLVLLVRRGNPPRR